ncbi:efflux transporter outer membrane subunit [Sphingomonas quercus]|uniref:Efflux transporter outer membrane subunit n=1 Tax=Sphingomonas quercus TaxID=2842451 RepID=A0ABS6BNF6_9SPHN|nr:efflux transporter outer membrane subunit [Sphingomonas quercus]MBU3079331.1 efflux transporter outer membrane subunit [Sphingomonas quercus]
MRPILPLLSLAIMLGGCTVGRDYAGPPAAAPKAAGGAGFVRADEGQFTPEAPAARWWEALGDPALDALVVKALAANPDLATARARLRQARATFRVEKANGMPSVSASALYAHARIPGFDFGGDDNGDSGDSDGGGTSNLNLYNLGFDASWEIDLFGGRRRTVEAARASAEAAEASLADAQVSLSADVAQAYVNLRDRQTRIALNNASVAMQEQMLALSRQRLDRGTASRLDVTRLEGQLDTTRAQIVPLNAERDAYLNQLAILTGEEPGALDATLGAEGKLPLPPATVAIGDPATMLRRRPDIRAAERTLASDTARIGAVEAARFPKLSFMGLIGIGGTSLSALSHLDDFAAIAAPQLSWSFLDFGRARANIEKAEGVRDEAEARYRAAVLAALRDAESALSRFRYRRVEVATFARAKASADEAVRLSAERYKAGTTTLIDLLDAQRQQVAAAQSLSLAEAGLAGDFVAIQKALGLGWSDAG